MNQRTFILLFAGMLLVAAGIIFANSSTRAGSRLSNTSVEQSGINSNAPVETIIWESMGQAILGSGSIN